MCIIKLVDLIKLLKSNQFKFFRVIMDFHSIIFFELFHSYLYSYLDLRIGMHAENFNFYFVHGLYCEEITEPLQQIRKFMAEHPSEFIIFDLQHFYNFSSGDYARLNKILFKIFEGKFYTSDDGALNQCTLEYASSLNRQLLIIYRYHQIPNEFWGGGNWPTPWPNQIKVKKLEEYLEQNIQYRSPDTGYTRQCVLTPPVKFIVPRYNVHSLFFFPSFSYPF